MKKLLLSATALTLMTGAAVAEVTVSGDARFGIVYDDGGLAAGTNTGNTEIRQRVRVFFNMSTETDSGVTFGAKLGIDSRTEDGVDNSFPGGGPANNRQLPASIFASVAGFHFVVGNANGAVVEHVGLWAGGLGFDGSLGRPAVVAGFDTDEESNQTLRMTYTFGGAFTASVSTQIGGDDSTEFAVKYSANGITVAAGADDDDNWAVSGSYKTGNFLVGAIYTDNDVVGTTGTRLYGTYTMGATTIGAVYTDVEAAEAAYGIGVTHDLGGGVKVVGAIGADVAGDTNAQLGITIGF